MLTLTTSLALLLSAATTNHSATISGNTVESSHIVEIASSQVLSGSVKVVEPVNVENYVRAYFEETPVLAEVARCESRFRQFTKSGDVLRGKEVADDVGVMQINEYFHAATAEKLGYDLHTLAGNLGYAKYLYEKQGLKPWSASAPCWDK